MSKELLSTAAIVLTLVLFVPYVRSIRRGKTKPHVFSWMVWGLGTLIVFAAQLAGGGGVGAWAIGVSGVVTSYIAVLAYRQRGDTAITRADWIFFVAALAALPCWLLTADPLWAVVTLTFVDLAGFGPTVGRAFRHPHEESATFFALAAVRNLLVVLALETRSVTTLLFPVAVGLACLALTVMLLVRRRAVARPSRNSLATAVRPLPYHPRPHGLDRRL
jgi:hypothetical protein